MSLRPSSLLLLAVALPLAACAPAAQWSNPSLPKEQWSRDQSECKRYAEDASGSRLYDYDSTGPGRMTKGERDSDARRERAYMAACMSGKGYQPIKR